MASRSTTRAASPDRWWAALAARKEAAVLLAAALAGLAITVANRQLPLIDEGLAQAEIHRLLTESGGVAKVCGGTGPDAAGPRGCGFALLSTPLVAVFGVGAGLKGLSWLGTVLFLAACWRLLRRFARRGLLAPGDVALGLAICAASPLVMYQFWSGSPDGVACAAALASLVLLDRALFDEGPGAGTPLATAYLVSTVAASWLAPAALVVLAVHLSYGWWHRDQIARRWREHPRRILLLAASFVLALEWAVLALLGWNPLLDLRAVRSPYATPVRYAEALGQLGLFVLLALGPLALLLPWAPLRGPLAALVASAALGAHFFTVHHSGAHHGRGYLALVPVLTLLVLSAGRALPRAGLVRAAMTASLVVTGLAALAANTRAGFALAGAAFPAAGLREPGRLGGFGLAAHLDMELSRQAIARNLPGGGTLYLLSDSAGGVRESVPASAFEHAGLIPPGVRLVAANSPHQVVRAGRTGPAYLFVPGPATASPGPRLRLVGHRLFLAER